jgi:beta-glucanase (GH16 family)
MGRWRLALALGAAVALGASLWLLGTPGPARPAATAGPPGRSAQPGARAGRPGANSGRGSAGARRSPEFDASFAGSRLDTSVWSTCYPWMDLRSGCTNFGNPEYQWYLPSQDRVAGGVLRLTARRTPTAGKKKNGADAEYSCRSGMVTTYPSLRFRYGFVQVIARIPAGPGLWPALWLAAADFRWPPEIDILEHWGTSGASAAFFHPAGAAQVRAIIRPELTAGWHTFSLSWTRSRLTWYADGRKILTVRHRIPHQRMYLIADLAESRYPRTAAQCHGALVIRSVKVWK